MIRIEFPKLMIYKNQLETVIRGNIYIKKQIQKKVSIISITEVGYKVDK